MRTIFLEKSYTSCGGVVVEKLVTEPFIKKSKLTISLNQQSENVIKFVFILRPSRGLPEYIKTKVPVHLPTTLHKTFLKKQKEIEN